MTQEPRWLIGGPSAPEQVTMPQQAAPKVTKVKTSKVKVEGTYKGKTADQWLKLAEQSGVTSQKSFERLCARLAEVNGVWEFRALFTLTGALVPDATYVRTRRGKWVWRIGNGPDAQWFDESKARDGFRRRNNDAVKGFYVGSVRARGYVGPSGSTQDIGYFIGQVNDSPVEIVDSGVGHMNLATQYQDRS